MSVLVCERCGHSLLDAEHACPRTDPAREVVEALRGDAGDDAEYAAWFDRAEAKVATRLHIHADTLAGALATATGDGASLADWCDWTCCVCHEGLTPAQVHAWKGQIYCGAHCPRGDAR